MNNNIKNKLIKLSEILEDFNEKFELENILDTLNTPLQETEDVKEVEDNKIFIIIQNKYNLDISEFFKNLKISIGKAFLDYLNIDLSADLDDILIIKSDLEIKSILEKTNMLIDACNWMLKTILDDNIIALAMKEGERILSILSRLYEASENELKIKLQSVVANCEKIAEKCLIISNDLSEDIKNTDINMDLIDQKFLKETNMSDEFIEKLKIYLKKIVALNLYNIRSEYINNFNNIKKYLLKNINTLVPIKFIKMGVTLAALRDGGDSVNLNDRRVFQTANKVANDASIAIMPILTSKIARSFNLSKFTKILDKSFENIKLIFITSDVDTNRARLGFFNNVSGENPIIFINLHNMYSKNLFNKKNMNFYLDILNKSKKLDRIKTEVGILDSFSSFDQFDLLSATSQASLQTLSHEIEHYLDYYLNEAILNSYISDIYNDSYVKSEFNKISITDEVIEREKRYAPILNQVYGIESISKKLKKVIHLKNFIDYFDPNLISKVDLDFLKSKISNPIGESLTEILPDILKFFFEGYHFALKGQDLIQEEEVYVRIKGIQKSLLINEKKQDKESILKLLQNYKIYYVEKEIIPGFHSEYSPIIWSPIHYMLQSDSSQLVNLCVIIDITRKAAKKPSNIMEVLAEAISNLYS